MDIATNDYVLVRGEEAEVKAVSDKAILVDVLGFTNWLPKSCITIIKKEDGQFGNYADTCKRNNSRYTIKVKSFVKIKTPKNITGKAENLIE